MSDSGLVIATEADSVVGRPIPRETLGSTSEGYLVNCTDTHCQWQGLFYDRDLAAEAADRHYDHERPNGQYHFGSSNYTVVELVDDRTACLLDESRLGLSVQENRHRSVDGGLRKTQLPRSTESVGDLVERGDRIELQYSSGSIGKVARVSKTRSFGLPTWTVVYIEPDVDVLEARPKRDYRWLNEQIARDGQVFTSYGRNPLSTPTFEVVGQTEHQSAIGQFVQSESHSPEREDA